ncbi:MAG: hypothetical protein UIL37_05660 [Clostridia bacterium]|nr:hypothetical protein [Clostridia bacterium]
MKKICTFALTAAMLFSASASCFAADVTLYALDGRTLTVNEAQITTYTAEGMGWYLEPPVTLYSVDGRTVTIAANEVEAYKKVGWYSLSELPENAVKPTETTPSTDATNNSTTSSTTTSEATSSTVKIKYTDGTVISVPSEHVEMYKALGWVLHSSTATQPADEKTVTVYDSNGNSKVIEKDALAAYISAGWLTTPPQSDKPTESEEMVTVYFYDGTTKDIPVSQREKYKTQGYYSAYDEAVYAYAAFGNGGDVLGATQLIENKKYEQAFNMVSEALEKLENTESEYVSMLYYLRTMVTDTWREAANSPLGFINYWFSEKDGKSIVVFEYRNVSNSRITSFRINFDICDKDGNVIETNSGSYYVNNLQMVPCDKKRVAWIIQNGKDAASIKNLKIAEVVFSDNTKWTPSV